MEQKKLLGQMKEEEAQAKKLSDERI